jgi:hypothetical protein
MYKYIMAKEKSGKAERFSCDMPRGLWSDHKSDGQCWEKTSKSQRVKMLDKDFCAKNATNPVGIETCLTPNSPFFLGLWKT